VPIYLLTEVGVSAVTMGLLLTLAPATQIGFMTLFGRAADVRGRKWLVVLGIVASGVYPFLLGSATLPGSAAGQVAVAGAGLVSIAAGFSAMDVGVVALLGDAVPASREAAFLGLRSTVGGLGGVVGPTLVGSVAVLASYQVAFALAGLLALGAAALVNDRVVEPESTDSTSLAPERTELATQMVEPPGAFRDADSVED
jgi:MFS family permease